MFFLFTEEYLNSLLEKSIFYLKNNPKKGSMDSSLLKQIGIKNVIDIAGGFAEIKKTSLERTNELTEHI